MQIGQIKVLIGKKHNFKFLLVWILNIFASILEVLFIGSLATFVSILLNFEQSAANLPKFLENVFIDLNKNQIIFYFSLFILFLTIFKNLYLLFVIYLENIIIYKIRLFNSNKIFKNYIYNDYSFFLKNRPSKLIRNLTNEFDKAHNYLLQTFGFAREVLIALFIFCLLAINNFLATFIIFFLISFIILIFHYSLKNFLFKKGEIARVADEGRMNTIQNIFGAFKSIKLLNAEKIFIKEFDTDIKKQNLSELFIRVIPRFPRLILETIVLSIILAPIIYISLKNNLIFENFIPTITVFTICALRLIPTYGMLASTLSSLRYLLPSFKNIVSELELRKEIFEEKNKNFLQNLNNKFQNFESVELKNLKFKYEESEKFILNNINLKIIKNSIIGIVGPSGSGKSTLIDTLLGFLIPIHGELFINNKKEKFEKLYSSRLFGYVPQDIFILNSSLKKNIALGEEENKIDDERVIESLKFANLYDFTKSLPNFINTEIKHRGVNLSGGQIQRIGIARAFYHEPEVIILDESTNSLDDNTEQVLLNEIHKLKSKKTFIIVSHKVSTISICDKVYSFKKGGFFE